MDTQETTVYTTVIIISVTVGSILLFFIIGLVLQHNRNNELYRSKIKAEINTLENERTRISADLHDELGPLLFAVKYKISSVDTSPEDQQVLDEASFHLDDIIERVRDISNDLMPGTLLRKGVFFAIEEFIDRLSKTTNTKMSFYYDHIIPLPKDKAVNLYRIIQEIVHNTLRHAGASYLTIEIQENGRHLILNTKDDGRGFNYMVERKENSGLGIRNLLNRTELMDGNMYIESASGKGTSYTIEIPL